jgi:Ig-like domain from next to BRCA1 gene
MKRRLMTIVITTLIALGFITGAAAFIGHYRDQMPQTGEAGHVLVITSGSAPVFDSSGHLPVRTTCPQDSRQLRPGWDVVALSNTPVTIDGYPYYQVAYPDPCQPDYDFSSDDQINQSSGGDGPAAVGYVAADLLSEANAVYPYSASVVWRDCWTPNRCNDRQLKGSNIQLNSADGQTLSAWWTGSTWDPHWWHIKGFSQEDAAVEGRSWVAVSTLKPAPPAQQFAYELKSLLPRPVQVRTDDLYQFGYVDFTLQLINSGDRPLNLQDTWVGANGLPPYCLSFDKDTALQVNNIVGCVPPDSNQTTSSGSMLSFHIRGNFPQSYRKDIGHFYVEYRGYPMLLDQRSSQGAVSFVWPTPPTQPILTPTVAVTQQPSPQPTVTQSVQQDNALLISQSQGAAGDPGEQVSISFTLQNTGTTTWSDNDYQLACLMACLVVPSIGFGGQSIHPDQQFTFTTLLTLPPNPGSYTFQWILEHNGRAFGPQLSLPVTVVASHWSPILQEQSPTCSSSDAAVWTVPNPGMTGRNCTNSFLEMQQLHNYYAEDDLTSVNGNGYNQTNFRVQVQVTFPSPGDSNTWAALVIQSPQGSCGGLIFALNASGHWQLQNVRSCTSLPVVGSGTIGLDAGQATTVTIQVQNNVLLASINGLQVLSYNDSPNPSQALVGLMVMSSTIPSTLIHYENFELDTWI